MNPESKYFDEINFGELLEIFVERHLFKRLKLSIGDFTLICQNRQSFHSPMFPVLQYNTVHALL